MGVHLCMLNLKKSARVRDKKGESDRQTKKFKQHRNKYARAHTRTHAHNQDTAATFGQKAINCGQYSSVLCL